MSSLQDGLDRLLVSFKDAKASRFVQLSLNETSLMIVFDKFSSLYSNGLEVRLPLSLCTHMSDAFRS